MCDANRARLRRRLPDLAMLAFLLLFALALILLNRSVQKIPLLPEDGSTFEKGTVVALLEDDLADGGGQVVQVLLRSGAHRGETVTADNSASYLYGAACRVGTRVVVQLGEYGGALTASVYNYDRGGVLWALVGLFLAVLCAIGGKRGLKSAVGLIFTFLCVLFLYLPLLYLGVSPFWAAVAVVALTTLVTLYLIGGPTRKSLCAILGTVAGVVAAGGIAALFGALGRISGYNVSDIETMIVIGQNSRLQIGGVLFSGILIASLGAVMDVAMSISSTASELIAQTPSLTRRQLFRSGINVGRDMMGTMSNTLILAFTGGSVNTLLVIYAYDMPYLQVINMYAIGIEILQGLAGTLGVILTVPVVAALSACAFGRREAAPAAQTPKMRINK